MLLHKSTQSAYARAKNFAPWR